MSAGHEYYSKHSRKVSTSQMNIPEQVQNYNHENANRSMTFLPATIYTGSKNDVPVSNDSSQHPDTFYRQYHNQHAQSAGPPLRQGASRTHDLDPANQYMNGRPASSLEDRRLVYRNGALTNGQDVTRPHVNSPGLRGRKSSVKNLVEQINATSTEDFSSMRNRSASRNGSRNVSPVISSEAQFQQVSTSRHIHGASSGTNHQLSSNSGSTTREYVAGRLMKGPNIELSESQAQSRRPLFGEVVAATTQAPTIGYGIQTLRKRSGSEGSPLPSPGFVSPNNGNVTSRSNHDAVTTLDANFTLSPSVYVAPNPQFHHRRANSESPMTPTRGFPGMIPSNSSYTPSQGRSNGSPSRIPIAIRRGSASSELDGRTPTTNSRSTVHQASIDQKQASSIRRSMSPPQIQSPGQRGKKSAAPSAPKSPSLRANIIVPPPKISPPLRSSRPRLPVSSASTAASRAKMAEKFSALQRMNEEKRQAARKAEKRPEFTDIDLKARRLRITQALSRSLEGQDLKGNNPLQSRRDFSRSRTASPAISDGSRNTDLSEGLNEIPSVVIDNVPVDDDAADEFTPISGHPQQERAFSQSALEAMQGTTRALSADDDSPTNGSLNRRYLGRPMAIQTNLPTMDHSNEPSSAVTEGTMIDPEPQEESVLSQINRMRNQGSMRDSMFDAFSDHGDIESVQIVLRNTMYLDDDEAVRKGYRQAPQTSELTNQDFETNQANRGSWISSMGSDHDDSNFGRLPDSAVQISPEVESFSLPVRGEPNHMDSDSTARMTMASDAYTIVNIVLQQHSSSGVVDQQFVDDVYHRVLEDSPFEDENSLSADRIEQICLQEIQDREDTWYKPTHRSDSVAEQRPSMDDSTETPTKQSTRNLHKVSNRNKWPESETDHVELAPPPFLKGHRYKSSLDSAEDWADTSPSVSDWMRFAANDEAQRASEKRSATHINSSDTTVKLSTTLADNSRGQSIRDAQENDKEDDDLYSAPAPRPPTQDPPPIPSIGRSSTEETPFGSAIIQRPQIPRRVTSISQLSRSSPRGHQSPSVSAPVLSKISTDEVVTPEQRRLKQRRNVIKELVDTEFSYEKDLRVLCDIYKQTASAALGEEDIKVLFGNVEQVQIFSKDFLMLLKSLARPTYAMERPDRKKEKKDKPIEKVEISVRPRSSSSTLASTKTTDNDLPTVEKDRETRIGQAFEASLADMEKVYTEYIKNRHAANLRLESIQKTDSAREWLKECKDNSSDITNAWNLDALLVKPVQRITKYPLLLKELVDSTADDHPDLSFLRRALHEMTEVNIRINDVKKHAELVDQVLNRKRKDSDVRAGLSKAFGRRAEKLKQHVGITELFEDSKYNEIKIHYDNNIVQLMVVGNDCSSYGRAITKWVNKMVEIAAAAEAWVDVGHSNHQEAESRLRQFAMVVRGISTIALPDHLEQLNNKVLTPMQHAVDAMTKFKSDPKGLLQKREKRMIDYVQIKSKRDRGEKIDRKMIERMEQSEALNVEAKERMRKLVTATAKLVQACQANLVQMQVAWQGMVKQKLSAAMGISLEHLEVEDITKEWQMDFDYHEASALSLGICNGSLLAEAVNMVNFQASATTLNGEESPRQASFTSVSKRSISVASENSYPPIPDYDPRTSGMYGHQYHEHNIPYGNPRARAQSTTSSRFNRTPDLSQHNSAAEGFSSYARYDPSSSVAPRLSVEQHSPLTGVLQPEPPSHRPVSSSTFVSAPDTLPPTQQQHQHQSIGSSVFSSAMPMSDSPTVERYGESNAAVEPDVLFTAASVYEFNIDRSRREAGFPYLTYVEGEIFDVIGERGELWLARNQDDPHKQIGWIWNKHFAKLAE